MWRCDGGIPFFWDMTPLPLGNLEVREECGHSSLTFRPLMVKALCNCHNREPTGCIFQNSCNLKFWRSLRLILTFRHRSFTFNSNKSPTWCNKFSVYYPDVCLQLNMFRAFSRLSSGTQWLHWQPLVLPSYRGDSRAVFVVGPAGLSVLWVAYATHSTLKPVPNLPR